LAEKYQAERKNDNAIFASSILFPSASSSFAGLVRPARIEPEQEAKAHRKKTKRLFDVLAGIFAEHYLFIA
jgi:hypothetical protein